MVDPRRNPKSLERGTDGWSATRSLGERDGLKSHDWHQSHAEIEVMIRGEHHSPAAESTHGFANWERGRRCLHQPATGVEGLPGPQPEIEMSRGDQSSAQAKDNGEGARRRHTCRWFKCELSLASRRFRRCLKTEGSSRRYGRPETHHRCVRVGCSCPRFPHALSVWFRHWQRISHTHYCCTCP